MMNFTKKTSMIRIIETQEGRMTLAEGWRLTTNRWMRLMSVRHHHGAVGIDPHRAQLENSTSFRVLDMGTLGKALLITKWENLHRRELGHKDLATTMMNINKMWQYNQCKLAAPYYLAYLFLQCPIFGLARQNMTKQDLGELRLSTPVHFFVTLDLCLLSGDCFTWFKTTS